ncbi:MAG: DUF1003 domain-containing protein [Bacteroidales bacterium]|nr:DUF1003 domain-containing protein [Bacteroidales bacterium]
MKTGLCQISKQELPIDELIFGYLVREPIVKLIKSQFPDWNPEGYISIKELNKFKYQYIDKLLETEKGELSEIEKEVIESIKNADLLSKDLSSEKNDNYTFGERISDKVADFGGSWKFIGIFMLVIFVWIGINTYLILNKPFDPYPFILLNLILSCVAALQAPVIMMSQNRQEAKDRIRAQHDYQINLKAEIEIRQLHEKLDHLLTFQAQKQIEINKMQIELLQELLEKVEKK